MFKISNPKLSNDECLSGLGADFLPDFSTCILSERPSWHAMRGKITFRFSDEMLVFIREGLVGGSS